MDQLRIPPLGWKEYVGDALMFPLMLLASGTFFETPQRTHRWNNVKFSPAEVCHLRYEKMVHCGRDLNAKRR